jgi:hypothetical protein
VLESSTKFMYRSGVLKLSACTVHRKIDLDARTLEIDGWVCDTSPVGQETRLVSQSVCFLLTTADTRCVRPKIPTNALLDLAS